jgi:hypothetical protein
MNHEKGSDWAGTAVVGLLIAAVLMGYLIYKVPGDPAERLALAFGYGLLLLLFFIGVLVVLGMATDRIDLSKLVCDDKGDASMSRFQLLIFTFVVALSFFYTAAKTRQMPEVPTGVLTLLGISASTYGVGKALQPPSDEQQQDDKPKQGTTKEKGHGEGSAGQEEEQRASH